VEKKLKERKNEKTKSGKNKKYRIRKEEVDEKKKSTYVVLRDVCTGSWITER
jgi:hypothetical protein